MKLTLIRPHILAAKLAAAADLSQPLLARIFAKQPRLMEALWFLQWQSMQPGGLEKFSRALIAEFPGRIGPAALLSAGAGKLARNNAWKPGDKSRPIIGLTSCRITPGTWKACALARITRKGLRLAKSPAQEESRLAAALAK